MRTWDGFYQSVGEKVGLMLVVHLGIKSGIGHLIRKGGACHVN